MDAFFIDLFIRREPHKNIIRFAVLKLNNNKSDAKENLIKNESLSGSVLRPLLNQVTTEMR